MMIVLLRHADPLPNPDNGLSQNGITRAKLLASMLASSGVTQAYCSDALRTAQTLEPLKSKLGAALTITELGGDAEAHSKAVALAVKALPAETTVVIVSHSNTVPKIIEKLGGGAVAPIGPTQFDKLFILSLPDASAGPLLLRY
jgi:phosphohistidine phosphatase SixA